MKIKSLILITLLATMFGCSYEIVSEEKVGVEYILEAQVEENNSRVAFNQSGGFLWTINDSIGVTTTSSYSKFEKMNIEEGSAGKASAKFVGRYMSGAPEGYAIYPYNKNCSMSGSVLTYNLPTSYTYTIEDNDYFVSDGTGNSFNAAMWAEIANGSVFFKHLAGVLCIKIADMPAGDNQQLIVTTSNKITGDFIVDLENSPLLTTSASDEDNVVTINFSNSSEATRVFYVPVPTGTYESITLEFEYNGETVLIPYQDIVITKRLLKVLNVTSGSITGGESPEINAQDALDAATDGTTIQLEPGVNYGTIVFRQNIGSRVVDITTMGGDAAGNEHYSKYENITIVGAPGAIVDQIDFQVGWIDDRQGASFIEVKNLTLDGITFSGEKNAVNLEGAKGSCLGIDGLTLSNCKMNDADGNNRLVFQQISGYKQLVDKSTTDNVMTTGIKNLEISDCEVTGAYMVIESRAMENLTIKDNTFNGIKQRDMLITSDVTYYPDIKYTGDITITGNTSIGGEERFIRASLNNSDVNVTICDNSIIDYKGEDADWIKITEYTGTPTIENNTCSYMVATVDELKSVLSSAIDNIIIKLAGVDFGNVDLYNSTNYGHRYNYANYEAKNVKIVGEDGTTFSKLRLGENDYQPVMTGWVFENIAFTGEGLQISLNNENVLVDNCKFNNSELMNTGTDAYIATNFTVKECYFDGSRSDNRKTQLTLQSNNGVKISDCTFNNSEYSAINMTKIYGSVEITDNSINQTEDRPLRFVVADNGATLNISGNTIVSDGDSNGELMKVTAESGITIAESKVILSGNTWNGNSDTEVSAGIVDGSVYIVK